MSADETRPVASAPPSKLPRLVLTAVLLGGAGAGAAWYAGYLPPGAAGDVERPVRTLYHTLEEELVVNFEDGGRARYLQVGIDVMTHDAGTVEALQTHAAVVRNNLILLFSGRDYQQLLTREGKESLREQALEEIRAVLESRGAASAVEEVFFTRFVMQ